MHSSKGKQLLLEIIYLVFQYNMDIIPCFLLSDDKYKHVVKDHKCHLLGKVKETPWAAALRPLIKSIFYALKAFCLDKEMSGGNTCAM